MILYMWIVLFHAIADCCRVLILIPIGFWNMSIGVEMGDIVPIFRFLLRTLAHIEHEIKLSSKIHGIPETQLVILFDLQQFAYSQIRNSSLVQGAMEFFRIFESNFPEVLKKAIVFNTARIFPIAFAIIKPFMSRKTISKVHIYGPQKSKWIPAILEAVPKEILPEYYGGTREGNDEFCSGDCDMWNYNEPLQSSYYTKKSSSRSSSNLDIAGQNTESLTKAEILAGSKLDFEFSVSKELIKTSVQLLRWQVKSEGYDIGFKVEFQPKNKKKKSVELIEYRRIDSHVTMNEGSLVCDKPGMYTLTLDNSYSKRRAKTVFHNIYISGKEFENKFKLEVPSAQY